MVRLQDQIDAPLVCFCTVLLAVDVFFISAYSINELYGSFYNDGISVLGPDWDISRGRPYAETFGYFKIVFIISLLMLTARVGKRRTYLAWAAIFVFVLAEDAWNIHDLFDVHPAALFDLAASIPLIAVAAAAAFRSSKEDGRNFFLLLAALTMLMLFAIVGDIVRMLGREDFRVANLLFYLIEDGGEQIMLSLTCGLAILIRRDVRHREGWPSSRA